MLTVIVKFVVTAVNEASQYFMVSVWVPTIDEELEEKVSIGMPALVETVTQDGVVPLSKSVTEVKPQIEEVVDVPY